VDHNAQIAPRRIQNADELVWDDEADVIVVGFGGAGAVAAIQARQCDASVIAVDRFEGGGATAYSGGVIYAGGTKYLRDEGYDDNADEMYKYLVQEGLLEAVGTKTLRSFCDGSNDDIEWIAGFGVKYGGKAFEGKTNYPPDGYYLYYTGNEKMPAFAAHAKPAPRGHRLAVDGFGGALYFQKLKEAALAHGVRVVTHAPVTRLVVDESDRVVGVEIGELPRDAGARHQKLYRVLHPWRPFNSKRAMKAAAAATALEKQAARPRLLRAQKGIILSTGGYNHDAQMFRQYHPLLAPYYHSLLRLGSMGDDGSGIRLGQSAGGVAERMDYIGIARTLAPPEIFAHGILVNEKGERFFNEAAYAMRLGIQIMEQPGGKAWLILNKSQFRLGRKSAFLTGKNFLLWGLPTLMNIFLGGTRKAPTLAALARKINVDPGGLERSVAEFNIMASGDKVDPFGKAASLLDPIVEAPFYALNFSMDNGFAPAQIMTTGGLAVDGDTGMVKRADAAPVIGLYAAGRAAAGIVSNGFVSGLTIADTVFSGRRAGRAAAGATNLVPAFARNDEQTARLGSERG
jgi:3-oxo-5alpha-steroid 4-dehydrogenase